MVRNRANETDLNSCGRCMKYMLLATNVIFWLLACAVIGIGVWVLVEKVYIGYIFNSELFHVACWMIIIGGCLMFFTAFLGCIGSLREHKGMLITYFISLLIIALILLIGGILALVFRNEIGEEMRSYMRKTIQNEYGFELQSRHRRKVTEAWDDLQKEMYCCAVEDQSWQTYRQSKWYNEQPGFAGKEDIVQKPFVPLSCCMRDQYDNYINEQKCQHWMDGPPGISSSNHNEALHYRGCYEAGYDFVKDYSSVICGIGIGVALTLICGIVFAIILYKQINY